MTLSSAALASMTYGQVEDAFHAGYITEDQLAGYQCGWRRSAYHYSSLAAGMDAPQSPEVEAIAAEISAAVAARRA